MTEPSTENLDRCYLEWSQFTRARTGRELRLLKEVRLFRVMEICKVTARFNGSSWTVCVGMSIPAVQYTGATLAEAVNAMMNDPKASQRGRDSVTKALDELEQETPE